MKKYFYLTTFFFLLLLLPSITLKKDSFKEVSGVKFPLQINYNNHNFNLNGAGVKTRWVFDLYATALYLEKITKDAEKAINCECPSKLQIVILTKLISVSYFHKSVDEWFDYALDGKTEKIKTRIQQFKDAFGQEINKYDDIEMYYLPNRGIYIYKNKQFMDIIPGLDFKIALSKLWLAENTKSPELREALLGKN